MQSGVSLGTATLHLIGDDSQLRRSLDAAGRRAQQLERDGVKIKLDADGRPLIQATEDARRQLQFLRNDARDTAGALQSVFENFLGGFGGGLAAGGVMALGGAFGGLTAALRGNIQMAVQTAEQYESITLRLQTLVGDAVDPLIKELQRLDAAFPTLGMKELSSAATSLANAGVPATSMVKILQEIGTAATVAGVNLDRVALIYTQVLQKGRLQGDELLQFAEAGINVRAALEKSVGASGAAFQKLLEQGKVTSREFVAAWSAAFGESGALAGALERQAGSIAGAFAAAQASSEQMFAAIGQVLAPVATLGAMVSDRVAGGIATAVSESQTLKALQGDIGKIVAALEPVLAAIGETFRTIANAYLNSIVLRVKDWTGGMGGVGSEAAAIQDGLLEMELVIRRLILATQALATAAGEVGKNFARNTAFLKKLFDFDIVGAVKMVPDVAGGGFGSIGRTKDAFGRVINAQKLDPSKLPPVPPGGTYGRTPWLPAGQTPEEAAAGRGGGAKGSKGDAKKFEPSEEARALVAAAQKLGISPIDLAAIVGYETGGTFSPRKFGGAGGRHMGLIQFGPNERQRYGARPDQSFAEQLLGPTVLYLEDRFKGVGMTTQGATLSDLYRAINGGNPKAPLGASDGNGTIASHIARIQREWVPRVTRRFFGGDAKNAGYDGLDLARGRAAAFEQQQEQEQRRQRRLLELGKEIAQLGNEAERLEGKAQLLGQAMEGALPSEQELQTTLRIRDELAALDQRQLQLQARLADDVASGLITQQDASQAYMEGTAAMARSTAAALKAAAAENRLAGTREQAAAAQKELERRQQQTLADAKGFATTVTGGLRGAVSAALKGDLAGASDASRQINEGMLAQALEMAFRPVQSALERQFSALLGGPDPEALAAQELTSAGVELKASAEALNQAAANLAGAGADAPLAGAPKPVVPADPKAALQALPLPFDAAAPQKANLALAKAQQGVADAMTGAAGGLTAWSDRLPALAEYTNQLNAGFAAAAAGAAGTSQGFTALQRGLGGLMQAFGSIAMGLGGVQQMGGGGGTYGTLMGLAGIFGAIGSVTGMFGTGGIFAGALGGGAKGLGAASQGINFNPAAFSMPKLTSFAGGGYTGAGAMAGGMDGQGGFLAMLHPNETITPGNPYAATQAALGGGFAGAGAAAGRPQPIQLETRVINGVEYATVEQLNQAALRAQQQGAEQGRAMTLAQMQNSLKTRKRLGMA